MRNYECNNCGIMGSDLPDGLDLSEYFDVMYGEYYCVGCLSSYEQGYWRVDEMDDDENDESI